MPRTSVDEQESARYSQLRGVEYRVLKIYVEDEKDARIIDEPQIIQFDDELSGLLNANSRANICLDFRDVDFVSSSAFGTLIRADKTLHSRGLGHLGLRNLRPDIYATLGVTGLAKLFDIDEASREAYEESRRTAAV